MQEDVGDGRKVGRLAAHFASLCSDAGDAQRFRDNVLRPFLRVRVSDSDGSRRVRQVGRILAAIFKNTYIEIFPFFQSIGTVPSYRSRNIAIDSNTVRVGPLKAVAGHRPVTASVF